MEPHSCCIYLQHQHSICCVGTTHPSTSSIEMPHTGIAAAVEGAKRPQMGKPPWRSLDRVTRCLGGKRGWCQQIVVCMIINQILLCNFKAWLNNFECIPHDIISSFPPPSGAHRQNYPPLGQDFAAARWVIMRVAKNPQLLTSPFLHPSFPPLLAASGGLQMKYHSTSESKVQPGYTDCFNKYFKKLHFLDLISCVIKNCCLNFLSHSYFKVQLSHTICSSL